MRYTLMPSPVGVEPSQKEKVVGKQKYLREIKSCIMTIHFNPLSINLPILNPTLDIFYAVQAENGVQIQNIYDDGTVLHRYTRILYLAFFFS